MPAPTESAVLAAQPPALCPAAPPSLPTLAWLDGRPRIGIHTSIAGDPSRALDTAARIGCTALQIFSASPRMWPRPHQRHIAPPVAQRFRERRAQLRLGPLAVHANYLINLASPDPLRWESSVAAFRDEIIRASQLGAEYLIVHPGSPRDSGIVRGIENVAQAVSRALVGASRSRGTVPHSRSASSAGPDSSFDVSRSSVRILFENSAGQGTGLASEFSHLRDMLDACRSRWDRLSACPPPGICLDTAHLLAAAFEIRTPEGLDRTLAEAGAAFGLENVRVIHCNDSKAPLGARIDRHQHIGRGHIGREAFARILNHPLLRSPDRAFLAETPIDRPGDDRRNVRALWSLLGMMPPVAPRSASRSRRVPAVGASRVRGIAPHSAKTSAGSSSPPPARRIHSSRSSR